MLYPVVIHKDPDSDYGVTVPDLPGCISAGDIHEQALAMAKEAIELHIEGMLEDGEDLPEPSAIEALQSAKEYRGGIWALVDVDTDALQGPVERVNITIPRFALRRIDAAAQAAGLNRSQYLTRSGLALPPVAEGGPGKAEKRGGSKARVKRHV